MQGNPSELLIASLSWLEERVVLEERHAFRMEGWYVRFGAKIIPIASSDVSIPGIRQELRS